MSTSSILSLGFGSFSDVNQVVTLGYGAGIGISEPPPPPPSDVNVVPMLIPARPPVDFVLMGTGIYGPRAQAKQRINGPELWSRRVIRNDSVDIQEMRQMYESWRQAA